MLNDITDNALSEAFEKTDKILKEVFDNDIKKLVKDIMEKHKDKEDFNAKSFDSYFYGDFQQHIRDLMNHHDFDLTKYFSFKNITDSNKKNNAIINLVIIDNNVAERDIGVKMQNAIEGLLGYEYVNDQIITNIQETYDNPDVSFYKGEGVYKVNGKLIELVWKVGDLSAYFPGFKIEIKEGQHES